MTSTTARDHAYAAAERIGVRQVLAEPLIVPSSRHGARELLEEQARRLKTSLETALEVDGVQLAIELVRQRVGGLVLTERALPDIVSRQLAAVPIRGPRLLGAALAASTQTALRRRAVSALWDFVQAEVEPDD